jgi:lipid-A-disaccharide synthase
MATVSYWVARALVRVSHIAMPNIVLGESVVPELIQDEADGSRIAGELRRYLEDASYRDVTVERLAGVRDVLVRPGAADRAAQFLLEGLS